MIKLLIGIDDTDNFYSVGTGVLAEHLATLIRKKGWGEASQISRHQLYLHEDIPYTSHNSSMCFETVIDKRFFSKLVGLSQKHIEKHRAEGSDPGLCMVDLSKFKKEALLIDFGLRAKKEVLTKEEAYEFANDHQIHLSEHGGTGLGVIGALAGCGLRLTGNDGRFRGKRKLNKTVMTVAEIEADSKIDIVCSITGEAVSPDLKVDVSRMAKTVLLHNQSTLLIQKKQKDHENVSWEIIPKKTIKNY